MNNIKKLLFFSLTFFYWIALPAQIITGAEQTERYFPVLQHKKVAVCFNPTSVIGSTHLVDTLKNTGINVVKIFAPEHGFRGEAEAGAVIHSSTDTKTGIPIVSLYGRNKKPTAEQLKYVDIIVFDMQDVGCRFFTYISTLHYLMEAAAAQNIPVLILDRPNPNGYFVDGPILEEKYKSFVGMHPVPVVHGMTIGEYAQMINGEKWLENNLVCKLQIIECKNYTRQTRYSLPIKPSPNLGTDEAIYLYPSLCLFEGTAISLGRGTSTPFQIFGHPNLTIGDYYFTPEPIKGVSENPPQKGKKCRGFNLTDEARKNLDADNSFNITYLLTAYNHFPKEMKFFTSPDFFDKLAGNATLRWQIINGRTEEEIRASWQPALEKFKKTRSKYLIYPE
ncbi:MAG: DUF1343 domain-containing protein [Bacteroidetes bacterium]|nr:DUF1343 domain-containing protein [Bacteroidota bacterium]MCL2303132.1 DUF1343 domain-containing protein [Lentimicrobiaceae bacterium]